MSTINNYPTLIYHSLHLISYSPKPGWTHASIIKQKLQQVFTKKQMPHLQSPSSTPFSLLNPNIISTLLSSTTILPPNYLYLQTFLTRPKNSLLSTLPLLDNLPLNSLVLLFSQKGKSLFFYS
jgi:hypothetical protein